MILSDWVSVNCLLFYRLVNFDLQVGYQDNLDRFDEGVEFAFRPCNVTECHDWIPIRFYTNNSITDRNMLIYVGNNNSHDSIMLRGYNVSYQVGGFHRVQLTLCSERITQSDFIQFRWLQTVRLNKEGADGVNLDNVKIVFNPTLEHELVLLEDDFNNQTAIEYVACMQQDTDVASSVFSIRLQIL